MIATVPGANSYASRRATSATSSSPRARSAAPNVGPSAATITEIAGYSRGAWIDGSTAAVTSTSERCGAAASRVSGSGTSESARR